MDHELQVAKYFCGSSPLSCLSVLQRNFIQWLSDDRIHGAWDAMQYPQHMLSEHPDFKNLQCWNEQQNWTKPGCKLTDSDLLALLASHLNKSIFCISSRVNGTPSCTCYNSAFMDKGVIVVFCDGKGLYHGATQAEAPFLSPHLAYVESGQIF